jgi:hypothetical protein
MSAYDEENEAGAPRASTVFRPRGPESSIRIVSDDSAVLTITAFDFRDAPASAAFCGLAIPAAYMIVSDTVNRLAYVGETDKFKRRCEEHFRDEAKGFGREVFAVTGPEGKFFKKDALYAQAWLFRAVLETPGWTLVNAQPPADAKLSREREATIDKMLADIAPLWLDARCPVFTSPGKPNHGAPAAVDDADDGDDDMLFGVPIPADAVEVDLYYGNLWARGYAGKGDPRDKPLVVGAGSLMRTRDNASIIEKIRRRRARLLASDCVTPVPKSDDTVRFTKTVSFPSPAIAAKVLTGAHVGSDKWRPVQGAAQIQLVG